MSLMTALYTGTSGMEANSQELSVVSDNIANANTIGFKAGRAVFEDALAQTVLGSNGVGQVGLGSRMATVQKIFTQGGLTNTGNATDLALQGSGFFVVKGSYDGRQSEFYTRNGQFTVDQKGYMVNQGGLKVQGYDADSTGQLNAVPGDLKIGDVTSPPRATANLTVKANLQADAIIPPAWDPTNPGTTSNFTTSVTAYDSLGKAHQIDVAFRRSGVGTWEWHAQTDGSGIQGGVAGTPVEVASGVMTFDTNGKLTAQSQTSNFNPVGATQPQALSFNLGDPTGTGGTGVAGVTQYASPSATTFINQDGYAAGDLAEVSVDANGKITGAFTNGQSKVMGQVEVANFTAPDQLDRVGGNLFTQSASSGQPTIGAPGEGGRASIVAGALEQSNVDLASEFVRMIAAQRGFQANSKTITTADSLLQELMNLKR